MNKKTKKEIQNGLVKIELERIDSRVREYEKELITAKGKEIAELYDRIAFNLRYKEFLLEQFRENGLLD